MSRGGYGGDCAGALKDGALQDGKTALLLAAQNKHEAVVRVLVDAGADKDLQRKVGWARIGS